MNVHLYNVYQNYYFVQINHVVILLLGKQNPEIDVSKWSPTACTRVKRSSIWLHVNYKKYCYLRYIIMKIGVGSL